MIFYKENVEIYYIYLNGSKVIIYFFILFNCIEVFVIEKFMIIIFKIFINYL